MGTFGSEREAACLNQPAIKESSVLAGSWEEHPLVQSAIQLSATMGWVRKCVGNRVSQTLSILGKRTE